MAAARTAGKVFKGNQMKVWTRTTETWPVMACIGVAAGWMAYMGGRALFVSPECLLTNHKARVSPIRGDDVRSVGEKWMAPRKKYIAKDVSQVGVLRGFEMKYRN